METVSVDKKVLDEIMRLAREGETQLVPYSRDNGVFAGRAADLSRQRCASIIMLLLELGVN